MNEQNKLDEVTGINALKEQLDSFIEYRKVLETAMNEMHKTIVNLSERVNQAEDTDEKINRLKQELDELRKPMGKMAESVGKIDSLSDRMDNVSAGLERTNKEIGQIKTALESIENKAEKSLELKKKLGDLVKFLVSD